MLIKVPHLHVQGHVEQCLGFGVVRKGSYLASKTVQARFVENNQNSAHTASVDSA